MKNHLRPMMTSLREEGPERSHSKANNIRSYLSSQVLRSVRKYMDYPQFFQCFIHILFCMVYLKVKGLWPKWFWSDFVIFTPIQCLEKNHIIDRKIFGDKSSFQLTHLWQGQLRFTHVRVSVCLELTKLLMSLVLHDIYLWNLLKTFLGCLYTSFK